MCVTKNVAKVSLLTPSYFYFLSYQVDGAWSPSRKAPENLWNFDLKYVLRIKTGDLMVVLRRIDKSTLGERAELWDLVETRKPLVKDIVVWERGGLSLSFLNALSPFTEEECIGKMRLSNQASQIEVGFHWCYKALRLVLLAMYRWRCPWKQIILTVGRRIIELMIEVWYLVFNLWSLISLLSQILETVRVKQEKATLSEMSRLGLVKVRYELGIR